VTGSKGRVVERLRPAAMDASLLWGRGTSPVRTLPSFLIVGAQRCGTTSLYRALVQVPAVLRPALRKGVHYFDTDYGRGLSWYRSHFPLAATAWAVQRRTGVPAQTFESSPYYMFHPLAGARIAADLPGVRIVALVRDPVERAYSAYTHELRRGFETESFERALELEPERLAGEAERLAMDPTAVSHAHQHNAYLTRGRYVEQLQRLEQLVGRDRLLVLDSQDFFDAPERPFAEVLRFLGLPPATGIEFDKHNARDRSPMSAALRARLDEHFVPYDEQLATWLGWTPSWRR